MSLLQKASIITTPTAYAEDYLYSIKPALSLGAEKVVNGNFATDSDWTKGTGWTISGGTANASATSNTFQQSSATLTGGRKYRVEFEITSYTSGTLNIDLGSSSYSASYTSAGLKSVDLEAGGFNRPRFYGGSVTCSIDNVSVKEITDADFDFDRNSTGTRVNEDYLIEDVPYNLLRYSENQLGGGVWGTTGATTVTASNIANPTGATENVYLISGLTGSGGNDIRQFPADFNSANQTLTFSVWLKGSGNIRQQMSNGVNQGVGQEITLTSHWVRHILTVTFNSTNSGSQFHANLDDAVSGTSATQFYMWGAQLVKGDQPKDYLKTTDRLDIPRIDYTNGEPSILLEPQRQNLYTYSSAFTNITDFALTVTDNSTTSPENLTNATSLVPSTANTTHYLTFPNTSTGTVTFSVYAKSNGYNFIFLHLFDGSNGRAWFNLETGKVGTKDSSVTSQMAAMPNGWYRCSVTRVLSGSLTQADIAVSNADNTATFAGDSTSGVFVYGAQLEVGSYATSLIHTSGSAVTRSADAANNAGNSDLFNDSEGVLYIETQALVDEADARFISIDAGSGPVSYTHLRAHET